MGVLELTIGRIIYLFESITNILFQQTLVTLKTIFFSFVIIFSFLLIFIWFKYELKNREEINKWISYFNYFKNFFFQKFPEQNFKKIKKIYYENKIEAFRELNNFLNIVLETFGYRDKNLLDKINQLNKNILPNLEDLKKAIKIVYLIEEKNNRNEEINLDEDEFLLIFHEYEKSLFYLNVLTKEDFLAKDQE